MCRALLYLSKPVLLDNKFYQRDSALIRQIQSSAHDLKTTVRRAPCDKIPIAAPQFEHLAGGDEIVHPILEEAF